ncbi:MAG: peptide ABC transporter ATP-binding protein [Anaerolineaceae bacterium]|nr:peptide ABC transporter ATP-binding protein [Anaerolineaceae bacterium]
MTKPVLQLESVSRSFMKGRTEIPVLRDINVDVNELEFLCLVGESGCGKTTTGKILSGLLSPSSGRVLFEGRDVTELKGEDYKRFRRSVQIIHQDPYASLNPTHTIYDILSFPLFRHGLVKGRNQARRRVAELLTQVDLTPVADIIDKYPHELSGGQRQRVSIARALTTDPSVIIADEAVSMVDVSIRISLLKMLMAMRDQLKVTIIFITHDLALAKYFAWDGRIAVMYLGRVVEISDTPSLTTQPQHPYTRVLLSAIAEPDPDRTRHKEHIQLRSEDIPSLTELPPGCSFHPRCPWFVEGVCDQKVPELEEVPTLNNPNHDVACIPLTEGAELQLYES